MLCCRARRILSECVWAAGDIIDDGARAPQRLPARGDRSGSYRVLHRQPHRELLSTGTPLAPRKKHMCISLAGEANSRSLLARMTDDIDGRISHPSPTLFCAGVRVATVLPPRTWPDGSPYCCVFVCRCGQGRATLEVEAVLASLGAAKKLLLQPADLAAATLIALILLAGRRARLARSLRT